jgi:hypothetical protein
MEPVRPTRRVSPIIGAWVERRRRHLAAQLAAADEERWEDLADLVAEADVDQMPAVESWSPEDRQRARTLLDEADLLNRKLAAARGRLLEAIDGASEGEVESRDLSSRSVSRGSRLDGYL